MRIVTVLVGLILLAAGAIWFFTSLLDAPVMSIAGALVRPGAAKLAIDNPLSLVAGGVALVGLALLVWGGVMGTGSSKGEPVAG